MMHKSLSILVWSVFVIFLIQFKKKPDLKSINSLSRSDLENELDSKILEKSKCSGEYLRVECIGNGLNGLDASKNKDKFKNLKHANQIGDALNKPYHFASDRFQYERSSAISLHEFNISEVLMIIASILIGFLLITFFQR